MAQPNREEPHVAKMTWALAVSKFMKYAGMQSVGAILSSRKGVYGIATIAIAYFVLLGRLPADASEALVTQHATIFGWVTGIVAALFIGGTALEDAVTKYAREGLGKDHTALPWIDGLGHLHHVYVKSGELDPLEACRRVVESADGQRDAAPKPTPEEGSDPAV